MRIKYRLALVAIAVCFVLPLQCRAQTIGVRDYALKWANYYVRTTTVPVELVAAVIQVESNWNPNAVSRKGARGLMQLMPKTAARFHVTNVLAIPENIRGGVAYLDFLDQLFKGDLRLVLAAYIAGEERILARGLEYSSREVFEYVTRVLSVYRLELLGKNRTTVRSAR